MTCPIGRRRCPYVAGSPFKTLLGVAVVFAMVMLLIDLRIRSLAVDTVREQFEVISNKEGLWARERESIIRLLSESLDRPVGLEVETRQPDPLP